MKIKLKFKRKYKEIKEKGGITREQYKKICNLIEDLGRYDYEEYVQKIIEIFPESPVKELVNNEQMGS
ncbi:MAG: hypothetical protein ACOCRO_00575 [Halanaerobiales bacterium]